MSAPAINKRVFTRSRRGYDSGEVDDYLERFSQYAAKLEDRAIAAESALEDCGNALGELRERLMAATGTQLSGRLAEILSLAEEEAHDIRHRARVEAQSMADHAIRAAEEVRRAAAEQRLEIEHEIRDLVAIRDGFLSDLRALGAQIVQATDRCDQGFVSPETTQERLPVFDAVEALEPVADPTEPPTADDDASSVTRR